LTIYTFKNGITIDIPAATKEQEIQKWDDIKWMISLFIDPPPPIPSSEEPEEKKQYTLSYKGYEKRKLKDKARLSRRKNNNNKK